jgi:hypothetical protein
MIEEKEPMVDVTWTPRRFSLVRVSGKGRAKFVFEKIPDSTKSAELTLTSRVQESSHESSFVILSSK